MQIVKVKKGKSKSSDILLWVIIVVLLGAGVVANYYFIHQPLPLRIVGWIILSVILLLIASRTAQGEKAWKFYKDSRTELQKVVWPTRQQTFQMTCLVIAMVIVLALLLWGIDSFLMWAITRLTG